jgi:hypothetical protein
MNNKEHIEKMIDEALNSFDGAARATPKPFLLTRINARLNKSSSNAWESAVRFIARPSVVIAGLCLLIGFNILVVTYNNANTPAVSVADQVSATDEYSTSVAALDDLDNTEPQ